MHLNRWTQLWLGSTWQLERAMVAEGQMQTNPKSDGCKCANPEKVAVDCMRFLEGTTTGRHSACRTPVVCLQPLSLLQEERETILDNCF